MEKEIQSKVSFLLEQIKRETTPDAIMKLTQSVTNLMNALCNYKMTEHNTKQ